MKQMRYTTEKDVIKSEWRENISVNVFINLRLFRIYSSGFIVIFFFVNSFINLFCQANKSKIEMRKKWFARGLKQNTGLSHIYYHIFARPEEKECVEYVINSTDCRSCCFFFQIKIKYTGSKFIHNIVIGWWEREMFINHDMLCLVCISKQRQKKYIYGPIYKPRAFGQTHGEFVCFIPDRTKQPKKSNIKRPE